MKRLRILGLVLMAVFALGAVAATTSALAVEAGVLTLKEVASLTILHELEPEVAEANKIVLKGAETLECLKLAWLSLNSLTPGKLHFTLQKDTDLHISECQTSGKVKCKTEGDENGTLLLIFDVHFVAFLVGAELVPGALLLLLNAKLENLPITLTCGLIKIELKGVVTAKIVQLNESLKPESGDFKPFTLTFEPGLKCDSSDELCKQLLPEKEPLLSSVKAGVFSEATLVGEPLKLKFDEMVIWDF